MTTPDFSAPREINREVGGLDVEVLCNPGQGCAVNLSSLPHQSELVIPLNWHSFDAVQLFDKLGLIKGLDAGMYFVGPIGAMILERLESHLRQHAREWAYAEVRLPTVHRDEWLVESGVQDRFGKEIFCLKNPEGFVVAATTEEPVLKYLQGGGLYSYRQLPLKIFSFNDVHRLIQRPEGYYSSRQIRTCVFPRLDASLETYREGISSFGEMATQFLDQLGIESSMVMSSDGTALEIFGKTSRADRRHSQSIGFRKGFEADSNDCKDDQVLSSLAMAYPFRAVEGYGIRFTDRNGGMCTPFMSTAGIGIQRVLLSLFEEQRDNYGIRLPASIRPFDILVGEVHGESLPSHLNSRVVSQLLAKMGFRVAVDDRERMTMKQRLAFADFYGIPFRVVIGPQEARTGGVELRVRGCAENLPIPLESLARVLLDRKYTHDA